jgi:hypothetical protein
VGVAQFEIVGSRDAVTGRDEEVLRRSECLRCVSDVGKVSRAKERCAKNRDVKITVKVMFA